MADKFTTINPYTIYDSRYVHRYTTICTVCGMERCGGHVFDGEAPIKLSENKKEEYKMFKSVKTYYDKYQDIILTVAVVFLLDQYMFDGKFRLKLEQIMESLISKATKKVEAAEAA